MRPAFKITVNGSDITALVADRLIQLSVTDEAGVNSDRVDLQLDDRDQRITIPPRGATMAVSIGYTESQLVEMGTYTIEEVSLDGPLRSMTLRGTSIGASKGAGAAREASWHDTTLGDIASSIASRHGWTLAISSELSALKIEHADQRENDLQFLSRLAAQNDAVVKVAKGKLVVTGHASGKSKSGQALPKVYVSATDTTDWTCTLAERGNYAGVRAMYHDPKTGQRGEILDGKETVNTHTLPHTYADKAAATRAAKSRAASLKRGKDTLSIHSMPGNPALRAEKTAVLSGFRVGVDGDWTIVRATHRVTGSGYTTSLECETPKTSTG